MNQVFMIFFAGSFKIAVSHVCGHINFVALGAVEILFSCQNIFSVDDYFPGARPDNLLMVIMT
jgi:hypothetical protein